jgi:DNA-binding LytR/AlgR family response regulator
MVHVAVVSDEPDTVGMIRKVCGEFMRSRGLSLGFASYENSYVFLQEVEDRKKLFEIVFLDTSVRGMNAVDTASVLRRMPEKPALVFLSATEGYCMDAFRLAAVHYLVTPLSEKEALEGLRRGIAFVERDWHRQMMFKMAEGEAVVDLSTLEAVVSDDHHQVLCLTDGRQLEVRGRMRQLEERLTDVSPFLFISPCRGILVNGNEISEIRPDRVVLKSGRILPVAQRKYETFRLRVGRFVGEEDWEA